MNPAPMFAEIMSLLGSIPWFAWIAIVAILSGSISGMLKMWLSHRERIEMIRHGIHPDTQDGTRKPVVLDEL